MQGPRIQPATSCGVPSISNAQLMLGEAGELVSFKECSKGGYRAILRGCTGVSLMGLRGAWEFLKWLITNWLSPPSWVVTGLEPS